MITIIGPSGKPFTAEYISDDRRVYANREKCFELHSFPYLRESDDQALQINYPKELFQVELIDPRWHSSNFKSKAPVTVCHLPPRTDYQQTEETKQILAPLYTIITNELYGGDGFYLGSYAPKYRGVLVLCVTLQGGKQLCMRHESARSRPVPTAAQDYFLRQKQVALAEAIAMKAQPVTQEDESVAKDLMEIAELLRKKEDRIAIARAINGLKWEPRIVNAVIQYGAGKTGEQCAALLKMSLRNFGRYPKALRDKLPPYLKVLFEGSLLERQKRNKSMDEKKALKLVAGVQISRDTADDDDAAYYAERFGDHRPDPRPDQRPSE